MRHAAFGGPWRAGFPPATQRWHSACSRDGPVSLDLRPPDPCRPLSVWPDQVVAGISNPGAARAERDVARFLDGLEQYRHANRDNRRKQQGRKKDFHGASQIDLSKPNYSAAMGRGVLPDGVWPFACSSSTQSE